jgi:antitoxin component of RelBE/YafQ-DinJ toxin-antitoxin module
VTKKNLDRPRKHSITIRIDEDTLLYFCELTDDTGIPTQTLINHYLGYCAEENLSIDLTWCPRQRRFDD